MEKILARCGIDCSKCDGYIATQANDRAGLETVAKSWSEHFGNVYSADACICDGCTTGGKISTAHASTCELRACAAAKNNATCANCDSYPCPIVEQFCQYIPGLKENLDKIRKGL
jgi:hypothetical protein